MAKAPTGQQGGWLEHQGDGKHRHQGRPNTLRRHPMTSTSAVTPLTSWEAASRPRVRHRCPASALRDPGLSGSRSHNAPTAPSPRRPSRSDLSRDAASWGTLTEDKGIQPANKRAGDSAYVRRARLWSDECSVESRVARSHSLMVFRQLQPRRLVGQRTHIPGAGPAVWPKSEQ